MATILRAFLYFERNVLFYDPSEILMTFMAILKFTLHLMQSIRCIDLKSRLKENTGNNSIEANGSPVLRGRPEKSVHRDSGHKPQTIFVKISYLIFKGQLYFSRHFFQLTFVSLATWRVVRFIWKQEKEIFITFPIQRQCPRWGIQVKRFVFKRIIFLLSYCLFVKLHKRAF